MYQAFQKKIKTHLNIDSLQGFILGSKPNKLNSPNSTQLFDMFEELLKQLSIEYSKFKGGEYINDVAYDSTKDEWIIGSELISEKTPQEAIARIFDEFKIANCDELSW